MSAPLGPGMGNTATSLILYYYHHHTAYSLCAREDCLLYSLHHQSFYSKKTFFLFHFNFNFICIIFLDRSYSVCKIVCSNCCCRFIVGLDYVTDCIHMWQCCLNGRLAPKSREAEWTSPPETTARSQSVAVPRTESRCRLSLNLFKFTFT